MNLSKFLDLLKFAESPVKDFEWSIPPDLKLGILTTNQAFIEAKKTGGNPKLIADEIKLKLEDFLKSENLADQYEVKVAGPYVNIDLTNAGLSEFATTQDQFKLDKISERVLIDYFSPNVGKKMHVGHIRSADIGESLRRILSLKYETVISNNHLGDWGIQFGMIIYGLKKLKPDFKGLSNAEIIEQLYKLYVKVNLEVEQNPRVKIAASAISKLLEQEYLNKGFNEVLSSKNQIQESGHDQSFELEELKEHGINSTFQKIILDWEFIVETSLTQYLDAENYLNLNTNNHKLINTRVGEVGINWADQSQSKFSIILGESYYVPFLNEFTNLSLNFPNVFIKEIGSPAIYVDLESEGLGRCYLISSEGYSLYHSRDIIARFVWAGLLEADKMLTLADNRQSHSFKQVFAIIKKIVENGLYEVKPFGLMTLIETKKALENLKKQMPEHVGFGFMTLPDGAMSTRKGKIVPFDELKDLLETKVSEVLSQKSGDTNPDLVRKVAVASLKWVDLFRDRDQDIVFDFNQFLNFEGNTGVYQLYTVARINSILEKNATVDNISSINFEKLNSEEILIFKEMYTLPYILTGICDNYKLHQLSNYLYEVSTKINSWYAKFSVTSEEDLARKQALLQMCKAARNHLSGCLELLGIEPVDKL